MSENIKTTEYQKQKRERDEKIYKRFNELIADGYMKSRAYEIIKEEYGLFSSTGVYHIVQKMSKSKK